MMKSLKRNKLVWSVYRYPLILVLALSLLAGGWVFREMAYQGDYYQQVKKNLKLFGEIYKNITERYVDEISPHDIIRAGIDGVLGSLDPYTVYYEDEESGDLDVLLTGQYGGIGITIGIKNNAITVISVVEGSPAQRVGILPGDQILTVDSFNTQTMRLEQLSLKVKGEPGTKVRLSIRRSGQSAPIDFEMTREIINVENIAYAGVIGNDIGYIRLTRFSKTSASDMLRASMDLERDSVRGMILDLRGNSGGLLDAAVEITNLFVPKGEVITFTRGRAQESSRTYKATQEPLFPDIPMAVLVDEGSASAAEIVAGALQDLDRAVIIGTPTFGKGLVQSVFPVYDRSVIKITTAKYYTPSGRCIQKEDYAFKYKRSSRAEKENSSKNWKDTFGESERQDQNIAVSDSATARTLYKTKKGRPVYAGGGIYPDCLMPDDSLSVYYTELMKQGLFFDFATRYVGRHGKPDSNFSVTEQILGEFRGFLREKNFNPATASMKEFERLESMLKKENYSRRAAVFLDSLRAELQGHPHEDFNSNRPMIQKTLELELIGRYFGANKKIRRSLEYDRACLEAVSILKDAARYTALLSAGKM